MLVVFDKLNNTLVLVGKVKLNCNLVVFVDVYSINTDIYKGIPIEKELEVLKI